jgi:hypothetical protein
VRNVDRRVRNFKMDSLLDSAAPNSYPAQHQGTLTR